jgi:hypothetical protein
MGFLRRLLGGGEPRPTATPAPSSGDDHERVDLRGELPEGHKHVVQGPPLAAVGESFYRDAIEAAVGQRPEGHYAIVDAAIALDPDNPVDPGAVAVLIGGRVCGHLSRADAAKWRPVLTWYAERGVIPVARGDVRGGWRQPDGTWADFGITLYIASPEDLAQRQRVRTEG